MKDTKQLISDRELIKTWLYKIGEKDERQIQEVMDLMRTDEDYREFILKYSLEAV